MIGTQLTKMFLKDPQVELCGVFNFVQMQVVILMLNTPLSRCMEVNEVPNTLSVLKEQKATMLGGVPAVYTRTLVVTRR